MVERRKQMPQPPEEIEGNRGFVWEKVFLAITELAKKRQEDVDLQAPRYDFSAIEDNTEYNLRINASLLNKGNLEIIVADLYCDGIHSQQFVVKAAWKNGKPRVIDIDDPAIETVGRYFDSEEIAMLSERLITANINIPDQMSGMLIRGRNFRISEQIYSNTIH
nr:hypothetical protein [Candidatus Levybacteria bacterium]